MLPTLCARASSFRFMGSASGEARIGAADLVSLPAFVWPAAALWAPPGLWCAHGAAAGLCPVRVVCIAVLCVCVRGRVMTEEREGVNKCRMLLNRTDWLQVTESAFLSLLTSAPRETDPGREDISRRDRVGRRRCMRLSPTQASKGLSLGPLRGCGECCVC